MIDCSFFFLQINQACIFVARSLCPRCAPINTKNSPQTQCSLDWWERKNLKFELPLSGENHSFRGNHVCFCGLFLAVVSSAEFPYLGEELSTIFTSSDSKYLFNFAWEASVECAGRNDCVVRRMLFLVPMSSAIVKLALLSLHSLSCIYYRLRLTHTPLCLRASSLNKVNQSINCLKWWCHDFGRDAVGLPLFFNCCYPDYVSWHFFSKA